MQRLLASLDRSWCASAPTRAAAQRNLSFVVASNTE
jgi:hypothetical protein